MLAGCQPLTQIPPENPQSHRWVSAHARGNHPEPQTAGGLPQRAPLGGVFRARSQSRTFLWLNMPLNALAYDFPSVPRQDCSGPPSGGGAMMRWLAVIKTLTASTSLSLYIFLFENPGFYFVVPLPGLSLKPRTQAFIMSSRRVFLSSPPPIPIL